jgi:hypothetical protein
MRFPSFFGSAEVVGLGLFNLKTGNYRTIIDLEEGVYILDKPIWSPEGWILLNILENVGVFNLYKLVHLTMAQELERLTQDWYLPLHPVIDITGEKIIYMVAMFPRHLVGDR